MPYGSEVVGSRLAVRWTGDPNKPWYAGRIAEWRPYNDTHLIIYDDGDQKAHHLHDEEASGQLRWEQSRKRKSEEEGVRKASKMAKTSKKSAAKKPAAKKPATKKPAAKKPAVEKPAADKPAPQAKVAALAKGKAKANAAPAAETVSTATVDTLLKENKYDYRKLAARTWPTKFEAGGAVLPLLLCEGGARFNTIAIGPPTPGGQWKLGYADGCRGPDLSLFCWDGGEASLAGLCEEPSNTGDCMPGHAMKWDALVARGSKGEVALCAASEDAFGYKGNAFFDNANGQSMCNGFHGALVRKVKPGQTFNVADPDEGLDPEGFGPDHYGDSNEDEDRGGQTVAKTITTKEGDIEVLVLANSISGDYCVPHLMRSMRSMMRAVTKSYDKKEAAEEFDGSADDWFSRGRFGMF